MKGKEIRKLRGSATAMEFCIKVGEEGHHPTPGMLSRWENDHNKPNKYWNRKLLEYKERKSGKNV